MKEVLEFNGHKFELETCEILESQGRVTGTLFVGEGRCWIAEESLSFEVHFDGNSCFWSGKAIAGFSSIITNEFGSFARVEAEVIQLCMDWVADKRPNKLQHAAIVANFRYGRDSVESLKASLAYWETQSPDKVVFSRVGEGLPIVGVYQTTVQSEIDHIKKELANAA